MGSLPVAVQPFQAALHAEGRSQGPSRVVLVGGGDAERGHHGVADELLDRPTLGLDLVAHRLEERGHDLAEGLGVEALTERRGSRDVGEQDRHELALLAAGRSG